MNGIYFLQFLYSHYQHQGQILVNHYSFNTWLQKNDGTISMQFNGCLPKKSIPQIWLIVAKDQFNTGVNIDRRWFKENFNANDCRVKVALWILENH